MALERIRGFVYFNHYGYYWGDRFLPWQLEGTPAESWAECERHAENLRLLLGETEAVAKSDSKADSPSPKPKAVEPESNSLASSNAAG